MSQGTLLKLTRESVVYGLGQAVSRGLQMALVPVFAKVFVPAEFGVIELVGTVTSIAAFLVVMGTDAALARFFYEPGDAADRQTLVSTLAAWRLGLSLATAGLLFAFAPWLSRFVLASPDYAKYLRIAAVTLPFTVFVFFQNDVLRVTFQPWKFITLNVLDTVLIAGLSLLFVLVLRREVAGVLYARLLGDGLAAAVGFVLIRHSLVPRFRRAMLGRAIRYGLPLLPAALAFWLISYADRQFLLRFGNLTEVGVYALAVKLGTLMLLAISAFQLAWGPFAYAHARDEHAGRLFARALTLYVAVAGGLALLLGLIAPEGLSILPTSYDGAASPGTLLAFGIVAFGAYSIAGIGANLALRTEFQAWAAIAAATVTVVLAFLLVRPFHLMGVAFATLAGYAVSTVLLYVLSQRVHHVPHRGLRALFLFAFALVTWAGATLGARALAAHDAYPLGVALRAAAFLLYAGVAARLARRIAPKAAEDGPIAGDQDAVLPDVAPTPTEAA